METATVQTETVEAPEAPRILNKYHDRCDRCGHEAWVIATRPREGMEDGELLFCAHHGKEHIPHLVDTHWSVWDFSDQLNED